MAEVVQNTICVVQAMTRHLDADGLRNLPFPPVNCRPEVTGAFGSPRAYALEDVVIYLRRLGHWCRASRDGAETAAIRPQRYTKCPVDLTDEQGRPLAGPLVLGKEQEKLTKKQSDVVRMLVAAWPNGVTKGAFEDADLFNVHKCLDVLIRKPGTAWAQVLLKPGIAGRGTGYCIADRPIGPDGTLGPP